MKTLFILNEAPYGNECSYNMLRMIGSLSKRENQEIRIFLIGDAVSCAKHGQRVPQGYYNIEIMLKNAIRNGAEISLCGTCLDARGILETEIVEGTKRSTLEELTDWIVWADKTVNG